jgi:transposase
MLLKTILNRVHPLKGFVYGKAKFQTDNTLVVDVRPRRNSRPKCGQCGRPGPIYETRRKPRRFAFIPILGIQVVLAYCMRRLKCEACGVKTERVPWAHGKEQMTIAYKWFLSSWARRLSWKETATIFKTSWNRVYRAVRYAVMWGMANGKTPEFRAIGVDEIARRRGHRYLTLVYQIDAGCRRLLWVAQDRTEQTLESFFSIYEKPVSETLEFVCSDMWKPYLNVIARCAKGAVHILDRFHVMSMMSKQLDRVRAEEARRLKAVGCEPILKHSRW